MTEMSLKHDILQAFWHVLQNLRLTLPVCVYYEFKLDRLSRMLNAKRIVAVRQANPVKCKLDGEYK